jgi:hypothetical protein
MYSDLKNGSVDHLKDYLRRIHEHKSASFYFCLYPGKFKSNGDYLPVIDFQRAKFTKGLGITQYHGITEL